VEDAYRREQGDRPRFARCLIVARQLLLEAQPPEWDRSRIELVSSAYSRAVNPLSFHRSTRFTHSARADSAMPSFIENDHYTALAFRVIHPVRRMGYKDVVILSHL
jgi:hypothetical protein